MLNMTCLDCGLVTVDPDELDTCGICRGCHLDRDDAGALVVDADTVALLDRAFAEPDLPFDAALFDLCDTRPSRIIAGL